LYNLNWLKYEFVYKLIDSIFKLKFKLELNGKIFSWDLLHMYI